MSILANGSFSDEALEYTETFIERLRTLLQEMDGHPLLPYVSPEGLRNVIFFMEAKLTQEYARRYRAQREAGPGTKESE